MLVQPTSNEVGMKALMLRHRASKSERGYMLNFTTHREEGEVTENSQRGDVLKNNVSEGLPRIGMMSHLKISEGEISECVAEKLMLASSL